VTNPSHRAITNRSVDLARSGGHLETITRRQLLGAGTTSNSIVAIFTQHQRWAHLLDIGNELSTASRSRRR
jgi:hypothetical protein